MSSADESKAAIDDAEKAVEQWKVKKLISTLEAARGNGTSMISLIVPPRDQISRVSKMLNDEMGTATNIKSRVNRQSVLGAITSTMQRLKLYSRVPTNGLVLYCGSVVTAEGKERKINIDFEPFKPINTSLYLCDNKFHTEALNELLESDDKFGFIIMDGNGALFGTLSGNTRAVLHKFSVDLPKKHGRGGQSALRFARLRLEKRHNYLRKVAETAVQMFISNDRPNVCGLILAGSAEFKQRLSQSDLFDIRLVAIVTKIVDVSYGGENGFNQAIELAADSLLNVKFIREKKLLSAYFGEIAKDSQKYCFPAADTRVLTSCGLLFLDQIQALREAGVDVLFGCYDAQSKALLYSKGELVFPQRPPPYLVEFTSAGEGAQWAEESGGYKTEGVAEENAQIGRVSLRVTPEHEMFVQLGNAGISDSSDESRVAWSSTRRLRDPATGKRPPAMPQPHRKLQAQDLLSDDSCAHVRMLACAEAGYAPQATSRRQAVQRDLHLEDTQFSAFIELLGFWLGDGSLTSNCAIDGSARAYVTFSDLKQTCLTWLRNMLKAAGLREDEQWLSGSSGSVTTLYVSEPAWLAFFEKEFGGSSCAPAVEPEGMKSVQHLPLWLLQELSAAEMRRLISGLHRADGSFAGGSNEIFTASGCFRDQLVQALLHCGYSAYAGLMYRKGAILGYKFHDQSSDIATCSISSFSGLGAEEQRKYRPVMAMADAWKVSWAELDPVHDTAAASSCWPSMSRQQCVTKVPYDAERDGRTWCVQVEHHDHLIIAQRAQRGLDGSVTKQSQPIVVGNCFGVKDTLAALELGAVEELIVWEALDIQRLVVRNKETGVDKVLYLSEKEEKEPTVLRDGTAELEVVDKLSLLEWLANNFKSFGARLQFVTNRSQEGSQFVRGFGGIGGLLRYQLDFLTMDAGEEEEDDFI